MSRALTAPELALIRSDGQVSDVFCAIWSPSTVFAAQINQTFTTHNGIAALTFDNVTTGAYTDALVGMTVYIGSSAGLYDIGRARVRKAATSSILYINETSEIDFADDYYITVVDDFGLWAKAPSIDTDGVISTDYDNAYTDENESFYPSVLMGATLTPLWLSGGTVDFEPDGSNSYCLGSSISTYAWSADGGSVANETTATPTFTFTVAGQYLITLTVTAANGQSATGHRYVIVYDADNMPYKVRMNQCSTTQAGWQFNVTSYDDMSAIPPQACCTLFSRDYYGNTQSDIGARTESAQVLATGWIDNETVTVSPEQGTFTFSVFSTEYWLEKLSSYPAAFTYSTAPTAWNEVLSMNVDRALWTLVYWYSTLANICDVTLTGDSRLADTLEANTGSFLGDITSIAGRILARPKCDQYGAMWIQIDSQYLEESDRAGIPVVMDITTVDWRDVYEIPEVTTPPASLVDLATIYFNGATAAPYFAKAGGDLFSRFGKVQTYSDILTASQSQTNTLAGLLANNLNNPFPLIRLDMASGVKVLDIAPLQYVTITLASADNLGGVSWSTQKFIPRRLSYTHNPQTGVLLLSVELEAYTGEWLSVSYERPQTPLDNYPPSPDFDDFDIGPIGGFGDIPDFTPQDPAIDPDVACINETTVAANGPFKLWLAGTQYSSDTRSFYSTMRSYLRSSSHDNKSVVILNGSFETIDSNGDYQEDTGDTSWYHVYGVDGFGARIATAAKDAFTDATERSFTFSPPASTQITQIEVALDTDTQEFEESTSSTTTTTGFNTTVLDKVDSIYETAAGLGAWQLVSWQVGAFAVDTRQDILAYFITPAAPVGSPIYLDYYYKITVTGATPTDLQLSVNGHNGNSYFHNNSYEGTFLGREFEGVGAGGMDYIDFKLLGDFPDTTTYPIIRLEVWVRPAASHRIVYSNAQIYNICSIYEE